ncbi:MAG: hypothetical protein M1538_01190 [Candidatus Marsarchaeota archaeon]|jgi:hypothetical protein|nr:hypothetical protein [Candidatus Marsarchaeota archaeon]
MKKKLIVKAIHDFELANKYKYAKNYIIASVLYRKATEKILNALSTKKKTQINATYKIDDIEYLVVNAKIPSELSSELIEISDEKEETLREEQLEEYDENEKTHLAKKEECESAIEMYEITKRLIDYASTRV